MNSIVTTITIDDPDLIAKLTAAEGQIIFRSPTGEAVRTVETVAIGKLPPGFKVPFTDEEMERRSQVRTGRPLSDVLKDLEEEKYGR